MTRFFTLFSIVALMAATPAQAQITYGGSPWSPSWNQDVVALPAIDRAALQAEDDVTDRFKEAPWRFGVEHDVQLNAVDHGAWSVEQGHRVWRLALEAEGATGMSVRFDAFRVPKGGTLFLAAADGSDFIGALDHRNMKDWGGLATGFLASERVVIEYRQPIEMAEMPDLSIDQVVQGYRALSGWPHGEHRGPFGNSGDCNINVNCPDGATWATEKRSVALIVQGGFAVCTVHSSTTPPTMEPYFLTANHCLGNPETGCTTSTTSPPHARATTAPPTKASAEGPCS